MAITEMSSERKKRLRALAKMMNKQNIVSIPVTKPLLDCFNIAITPEETDFLLKMGMEPHSYDQVVSLSDLPDGRFRTFFEGLLKKGVVWMKNDERGEESYSLAPIMVGWIEIYLSDGEETPEKIEFSYRLERFFQLFKSFNFFPIRNIVNSLIRRTSKPLKSIAAIDISNKKIKIEVDRTIQVPPTNVYPTRSAEELVERYGDSNSIALMHCLCRQWHKMIGEPCRFDLPSEACIVIGEFAEHIVKYGIGRRISKDDALKILSDTQKKGAVHTVFYEKEDINLPEIAICNCCWDCCGVLGSYNKGITSLNFKSYYYAQIPDDSLCTGCRRCEKYCPTNAITIVDKKPLINIKKCIGCGQCAFQCPEEVITLSFKEREVLIPIQKRSEVRIPSYEKAEILRRG